jgi:hypothetical protein
MSLHTRKKITRRSWDVIPMPDTVLSLVNKLAADQPEQFVFTDRHGRQIGDVELPGVYGDTTIEIPDAHDDAPPQLGAPIIESDLDVEQESALPEHKSAPLPDPVLQENDESATAPEAPVPLTVHQETTQGTHEIPGVRRSTRVKFTEQPYTPSMTDNKYEYDVSQISKERCIQTPTFSFSRTNHTNPTS